MSLTRIKSQGVSSGIRSWHIFGREFTACYFLVTIYVVPCHHQSSFYDPISAVHNAGFWILTLVFVREAFDMKCIFISTAFKFFWIKFNKVKLLQVIWPWNRGIRLLKWWQMTHRWIKTATASKTSANYQQGHGLFIRIQKIGFETQIRDIHPSSYQGVPQ